MKVMTSRFGQIEIDNDKIIEMPDGVIGFPERRFALLLPDNNDQFFWLQSMDNPALAFVVTDPAAFVPGYDVTLTPEEYDRLKLNPDSPGVILLAVTTISQETKNITINLQGPIVVNPANMTAKQIVLENGKYATRHPLFSAPEPGPCPEKEDAAATVSRRKIAAICSNL